jgi:chaperonin GroES
MFIVKEVFFMKVKPLNDRVLVQRLEEMQVTKGGIYIPDTAKEKPVEGKVIAVGPGKINEQGNRVPLNLKEGDRILFGRYAGSEIKVEGEDYLMMREDDILAIIED